MNQQKIQNTAKIRQSKGLFITATGTDVGKTYVTALMIRALRQAGLNAGYYKAALSGASTIAESDAGYVNRIACIRQPESTLVTYLYREAVSPHLAAKLSGNPPQLKKIIENYKAVQAQYDYVTVEGSGGVICPMCWDEQQQLLLEHIIQALNLGTIVVADAGLGTINSSVLTIEYLRSKNIPVRGVILNQYTGGIMQEDNAAMIEQLAKVPILAKVPPQETNLHIPLDQLKALYL